MTVIDFIMTIDELDPCKEIIIYNLSSERLFVFHDYDKGIPEEWASKSVITFYNSRQTYVLKVL